MINTNVLRESLDECSHRLKVEKRKESTVSKLIFEATAELKNLERFAADCEVCIAKIFGIFNALEEIACKYGELVPKEIPSNKEQP